MDVWPQDGLEIEGKTGPSPQEVGGGGGLEGWLPFLSSDTSIWLHNPVSEVGRLRPAYSCFAASLLEGQGLEKALVPHITGCCFCN